MTLPMCTTPEPCARCGKSECGGAPRFKGLCAELYEGLHSTLPEIKPAHVPTLLAVRALLAERGETIDLLDLEENWPDVDFTGLGSLNDRNKAKTPFEKWPPVAERYTHNVPTQPLRGRL